MIRAFVLTNRHKLLVCAALTCLALACFAFSPQLGAGALVVPLMFGTMMSEDDTIRNLANLGVCDTRGFFHGYIQTRQVLFTETAAGGTYTGKVALPAGASLIDIIIDGVAVWTSNTSASLIVGDGDDDNGYYVATDLKATDLLAGESFSLSFAGGKAGAYVANSQVSPRYAAAARNIIGLITKVGTTGAAGRTRMTVIFSTPRASDIVDATYAA